MNSGEDWTEQTVRAAEDTIGYSFRDKTLLKTCFTHKSYTNHFHEEHNERLEFLGDAVLGLAVTDMLYHENREDEGRLTELRKQFVSRSALERAEERARLMRFMRYFGGEENVRGKTASNLFEAVTAGIYLDGGMEEVKRFLKKYLTEIETENYKTILQEYVQERTKKTPAYSTKEENGKFLCRVSALGCEAHGEGESKKAAETQAAKNLYTILIERDSK